LLPAQTWREIMAFAHQGLEPKPPFGVAAPAPAPGGSPAVAASKSAPANAEPAPPMVALSPRATKAIEEIGALARQAQRRGQASAAPSERGPASAGGVAIVGARATSP
jgi:penicillin-binding protein 1A